MRVYLRKIDFCSKSTKITPHCVEGSDDHTTWTPIAVNQSSIGYEVVSYEIQSYRPLSIK